MNPITAGILFGALVMYGACGAFTVAAVVWHDRPVRRWWLLLFITYLWPWFVWKAVRDYGRPVRRSLAD